MRKLFFMTIAVLLLLTGTACDDIKGKKTTIQITDNNRHYYPILMGQELNIVFPTKNTGKNPFILEDIITSCGCITLEKSSIGTIPPGNEAKLVLTYNSAKGVVEVQHYITLYGNFAASQKMALMFDVQVVPQSLCARDYEEMFQEEKDRAANIEDLAEGNETNKGYYLD